jgi:hypothetical protein
MPFQKGNTYSKGRPRVSLNKPELLLPVIFLKSKINWANDFCKLYKEYAAGNMTKEHKAKFQLYLELMPYLCTKIALKDLDAQKFTTPEDSKAMALQTNALLRALEQQTDGPNPKSDQSSATASVENGKPQIPPTA